MRWMRIADLLLLRRQGVDARVGGELRSISPCIHMGSRRYQADACRDPDPFAQRVE